MCAPQTLAILSFLIHAVMPVALTLGTLGQFLEAMNQADNQATSRLLDGLINSEVCVCVVCVCVCVRAYVCVRPCVRA